MTVLKEYNSSTSEWDVIVTGDNGGWDTTQTINAQTGTTYTVLNSDLGKLVTFSNTSAITVSVTTADTALASGQRIDFLSLNTGQITISAGSGVTLNGTPGLKLRTQYSAATLLCLSTDTYVLIGDTVA
jgi:hypothetical protein